jgi:spermidine synthase
MRGAYLIVFLASFTGMTLELAGARLLAQVLGVSLYTWTGLIGVMLAGTAAGNWLGGLLADRAAKSADPQAGPFRLALCLALAAIAVLVTWALDYVTHSPIMQKEDSLDYALYTGPLTLRVLVWTAALFFLPMFLLGTISPQVIRLAVPDVAHAARVAGRVYAWSTAGAIAGTFATGFLLISELGMHRTILFAAALPVVAAVRAANVWERPATLYSLSIVAGGVVAGVFLGRANTTEAVTRETNYYTITVQEVWYGDIVVRKLILDTLIHSTVMRGNPRYLEYLHEYTQVEFLQAARARHPDEQRVLVIGGGGYTFPRAARSMVPTSHVDVVEIDKGVTAVAHELLFLDHDPGIVSHHMDGRQFVAERAPRGHYHVVTLDAVNDLAVPSHLLTKEFNDAVKLTLTPDGVYLLTVIDHLKDGQLWRAAVHTLRKTFAHVELLSHYEYDAESRQVYVIYAADAPFDLGGLRRNVAAVREMDYGKMETHAALAGPGVVDVRFGDLYTRLLPDGEFEKLLAMRPAVILTDQFAPVDYMMADVFSRRKQK